MMYRPFIQTGMNKEKGMEYFEGMCPHCNEKMQIPKDRETIICMYCGKEFAVNNRTSQKTYEEAIAYISQNWPNVFTDRKEYMRAFKRDIYAKSTQEFLAKYIPVYKYAEAAMRTSTDKEQTLCDIAAILVNAARQEMDNAKKIDKERMQMDLNMYMAIYVLPSVLEYKGEYSAALNEKIEEIWDNTFKNSKIKGSTFEAIQGGFRRKLCYITTAVCSYLKKPEDCYEVTLLKNYRDSYLLDCDDGAALIHQYYDIAPTIVKRINKQKNSNEIYEMIWKQYLSPCISYIEENRNEECKEIYSNMVLKLHKQFMEA